MFIYFFIYLFIYIIFILLTIAFFTLLERKVMSSIQRRRGPNIVGLFGILQPFTDGIKLLLKEILVTNNANILLFFISPIFTFTCTLVLWLLVPLFFSNIQIELQFSLLFILAIASLSIYGIIFAGWASNSKYSFLGGIRSTSQMISYEICNSTIYICFILLANTLSIIDIIIQQVYIWNIIILFPIWIVFIITSLAETNRSPFDLPEAEAELVAGYNVEYSAISFAFFFLAEYGNIIFASTIMTIFFFGGWVNFLGILSFFLFIIKLSFNMFIFLWVRAAVPRYRYDQLMKLGWKILIPFSFCLLLIQSCIMYSIFIFN